MKKFLKSARVRIMERNGSATIEFVTLAIPLFIPFFFFINQYATESNLESSLKSLAREMVRAAVTSENDEIMRRVAAEVFQKGGDALGLKNQIESGEIQYELVCSKHPCISPESEIQVAIAAKDLNHIVSTVEYVSPWS